MLYIAFRWPDNGLITRYQIIGHIKAPFRGLHHYSATDLGPIKFLVFCPHLWSKNWNIPERPTLHLAHASRAMTSLPLIRGKEVWGCSDFITYFCRQHPPIPATPIANPEPRPADRRWCEWCCLKKLRRKKVSFNSTFEVNSECYIINVGVKELILLFLFLTKHQ